MISLRRLFNQSEIPPEYRSNFINLYFDIGWYGLLAGSAVNFLTVYVARLGASGQQIGFLGAVSALVNLLLAIPAGRWLEKQKIDRAVFWTSLLHRLGFILWVPLPWIFGLNNLGQIWSLIALNLLMGIPLTALGVGFNVLFASAVPADWRAYVAGIRNVVLSVTFMLTSLVSGYILNHVPFPVGYQIVFFIGFLGAMMSSLHLYFIKPLARIPQPEPTAPVPETTNGTATARPRLLAAMRFDILRSPFGIVLLMMLAFHLAQQLAIPIFPLYFVNALHLTDEHIGIGTALFYLSVLLGSTQLHAIVRRIGHKAVTGIGVIGMGLYPGLLGLSTQVWHFYGVSFIGGIAWSLVGGAYANYMLENIPEHDRPAHLAWYMIVLNGCVLIGSLVGPLVADAIGLVSALLIFGVMRALAGLAILKWG